MKRIDLGTDSLYYLEKDPKSDERGLFERVFCKHEISKEFINESIAQANRSLTRKKGTFRGLHMQKPPYTEIKLVQCLRGKVRDFVVDLRSSSNTFLKTFSIELSDINNRILFIPKGFAHGFQTLEDDCELLYFHSEEYHADAEFGVSVNDPQLSIKLPLPVSQISERDSSFPLLPQDFKGFNYDL